MRAWGNLAPPDRRFKLAFMEIYLLRHGLAVARGTPGFKNDAQRPLTAKGKKQLQRVGRAMAALNLDFDVILTSPFRRARETAEIVATALKARKKAQNRLKVCASLAADRKPTGLIRSLPEMNPPPQSVLLVGHEPFLSELISRLTTGGPDLAVDFPKAGLCKLNLDKWRARPCARLAWLLTPQQMKKIG
jgi:phosphohistidine phosphatase